jgi:sec-independent protein translocase protein TatC
MALVPFPSASPDPARENRDLDSHLEPTDHDDLDADGARMSFLEHLDELRRRLLASVIALGVGCVIAFIFVGRIWDFVMVPLHERMGTGQFIYTSGFEPFMLTLKIGVLAGLFVASPFIIWQFWLFIAPGLYTNEKRFAIPFVLSATILFLTGAAFSHYIAFPWTWGFFLSWQNEYMRFLPTIGFTFSIYVKMILAFGAMFQMPVIVFFLARMGVVTARMLIRHFKYALLIIFILGAVLSPGGDIVSQALMAGPMLVLYGVSILVAWACGKRRRRAGID